MNIAGRWKKTSGMETRWDGRSVACAGVRACNIVVYQFRGPGRLRGDRKGDVIGAYGRGGQRRVARKFDRTRRALRKSRSFDRPPRCILHREGEDRLNSLRVSPRTLLLIGNCRGAEFKFGALMTGSDEWVIIFAILSRSVSYLLFCSLLSYVASLISSGAEQYFKRAILASFPRRFNLHYSLPLSPKLHRGL